MYQCEMVASGLPFARIDLGMPAHAFVDSYAKPGNGAGRKLQIAQQLLRVNLKPGEKERGRITHQFYPYELH